MGWEWNEEEIDGLPPEGEGLWVVSWTELTRAKSSGAEMVKITFSREDHTLYDQVVMEGKGRGIAFKKLRELGVAYQPEENSKRWTIDDAEQWRSRRVYLTVIHEDYEGKPQAKVDFNRNGEGWHFGYKRAEADYGPANYSEEDKDIPF